MAAIIAILIVVLLKWMDGYTRHGQYITVPDVSGLSIDMASQNLTGCGLRYEISEYRYNAGLAEGAVIEQIPKAGSGVKEGRIVYLTLNSGRIPTVALPDVADNSSLRAAESKLTGAGFVLTEPEYIPGEKDWVYKVIYNGDTIAAGDYIPEGATLTIVAGNGEEAVEELPDSLAEAGMDMDFFNE
ncbi:MAG: PASTA domain-containing protein [Bacteroidaceae bacterium]|nr:PASTA domain-containing protein [Bacteroidaceae bacterium]